MPSRLILLLLVLAAWTAPASAQVDGAVKMTPEFYNAFPFQQSKQDVTVKFPVLINSSIILKPGTILRTMYTMRSKVEGPTDLVAVHQGNKEMAYSRDTSGPQGVSKMSSEQTHELERYRRTVWTAPNNFMLAMAQFPTDSLHLMYSITGRDIDTEDARFSFFDGLLLGLPNGKVTVLGVEKDSKADRAGLKAGDEIIAVGAISVHDDLPTFVSAFSTTKKIAKDNEISSYQMTIRSPSDKSARTIEIAMPTSFKSGLMHGI